MLFFYIPTTTQEPFLRNPDFADLHAVSATLEVRLPVDLDSGHKSSTLRAELILAITFLSFADGYAFDIFHLIFTKDVMFSSIRPMVASMS